MTFDSTFDHRDTLAQADRKAQEIDRIHKTLDPILEQLAVAEQTLHSLGVFGTECRYRLARARVEMLRTIRSAERTLSRSEASFAASIRASLKGDGTAE